MRHDQTSLIGSWPTIARCKAGITRCNLCDDSFVTLYEFQSSQVRGNNVTRSIVGKSYRVILA